MRFLADESCDFGIVLALRAAGHDMVAIAEVSPREEDSSVMERALQQERIVVTEDKDFGQLVYANRQATGGVLFLRFPAKARASIAKTVLDIVRRRGETLKGKFAVVQHSPWRNRSHRDLSGFAGSSGSKKRNHTRPFVAGVDTWGRGARHDHLTNLSWSGRWLLSSSVFCGRFLSKKSYLSFLGLRRGHNIQGTLHNSGRLSERLSETQSHLVSRFYLRRRLVFSANVMSRPIAARGRRNEKASCWS